jgi:hypothetical protein
MTAEHIVTVYGTAVMVCSPDGIPVDTDGVTADLVGEAIGQRVDVVVVPAERLTDDFFDIPTGVAAALTQKFSTYGLRVAVVGDLTPRIAADASLRDWVEAADQGGEVWFCQTFEDFQSRLDRRKTPRPM